MIGARTGSITAWHFFSASFSLKYPVGATPGRNPISHRVRKPRFTFTPRLSFSSFAWLPNIIRRNFSFGLFRKLWLYVRISCKPPASMRSTILPRSPAFLLIRSGAHVRMPLYLPARSSSTISLNTGRVPVSLAECDSLLSSTTSNPSRSANWSISLIWLSIESTCRSSLSVLFLAYRQYFTLGGTMTCLSPAFGLVMVSIPQSMTQRF